MEIIRPLLGLLGLAAGIVFISVGGYHLLMYPFLFNSYGVLNLVFVVGGAIALFSTVVGVFHFLTDRDSFFQIYLAVFSFLILLVGPGMYKLVTSRVTVFPASPVIADSIRKMPTSTDGWASMDISYPKDRLVSIASPQPFYVKFGKIEGVSTLKKGGVYGFNILTTEMDFPFSEDGNGFTPVTVQDLVTIRLSEAATASESEVYISSEASDNSSIVKEVRSNYYWNWGVNITFGIILFSLAGVGGFYAIRELDKRHKAEQQAKKKQEDEEAEAKRIIDERIRIQREKNDAEQLRREKERSEREAAERQAKFAKLVQDIDPDALFKD